MSWIFLSIAVALGSLGTAAIRASSGLSRKRWLLVTVIAWPASWVALSFALRQGMALGVAYGIWTACALAVGALVGRLVFKDRVTKMAYVGMALVALGSTLVQLGVG